MTRRLLAPELDPEDEVQFVAHHRVAVPPGDYTISVRQTIDPTFKASHTFSVLPERFELQPATIHAVFPPAASRGDFQADLPHLVLTRSTLPWERTALRGGKNPDSDPPWLAVLLFHQDEVKDVKASTVKLSSIGESPPGSAVSFPALRAESGQHADDLVRVIDVPKSLLADLLPSEFDYHSHARRRLAILKSGDSTPGNPSLDADGARAVLAAAAGVHLSESLTSAKIGSQLKWHFRDAAQHAEYEVWYQGNAWAAYRVELESAVVLGNRLPASGGRNVVHLVSLEERYQPDNGSLAFDFGDGELVRLVSLHSWEFFCESPAHNFTGLLSKLNKQPKNQLVAADEARSSSPATEEAIETSPTFRLPDSGGEVESYFRAGLVPLRHRFRQGDRSVSWYHGPLVPEVPAGAKLAASLPATAADQLLIYDKGSRMFDVSYAAAWELGRMLMLQNRKVALSLFNWKRQHAAVRRSPATAFGLELPKPDDGFPPDVDQWLHELGRLVHVPFHYLAPDERLLPAESIRFFSVDPVWLDCLCDGALTIGRVLKNDHEHEHAMNGKALAAAATNGAAYGGDHSGMSGFLLRSEVVSGWPGLRVDASSERQDDSEPLEMKLPLLRMERLSKNVLLCLFKGDFRTLDIHLSLETLHFGFDWDGTNFAKKPRDSDGKEQDDWTLASMPWSLDKDGVANTRRLLNFSPAKGLPLLIKQHLQSRGLWDGFKHSGLQATFAVQMVAGVQLVRFLRPASSTTDPRGNAHE